MNFDYEMAAFMLYVKMLIWNKSKVGILKMAALDTDITCRTWKMLEIIASELQEKEN